MKKAALSKTDRKTSQQRQSFSKPSKRPEKEPRNTSKKQSHENTSFRKNGQRKNNDVRKGHVRKSGLPGKRGMVSKQVSSSKSPAGLVRSRERKILNT
jgi:hypothetical protein